MREGAGNRKILKLRKLEEEMAAAQQAPSERQDPRAVGLQTSIRRTFRPVRPQASVETIDNKGERVADDDRQQRANGHHAGASSNRRAKFFIMVPPDSKFLEILSNTEILDPKFQTEPVVEKPRRRAPLRPTVSTPPKRRSALDFSSEASPLDNEQGSQLRCQTTPSDWSPSQRGPHSSPPSSPSRSKGQMIQETDDEDEDDQESRRASPISAESMQIDKDIVSKNFGEKAPRASRIRSDSQSACRSKSFQQDHPPRSPAPAQCLQLRSLSPGSLLVPSSSAISAHYALVPSPLAQNLAKGIRRKVAANTDLIMDHLSGLGNILVPNSDTSGTASHSQPSQSKSQRRRRFDQIEWFLDSQSQGRDQTQDSPIKSAPGANQIEQEQEEQEHPITQSLSYTSQSQSQAQQQSNQQTRSSQGVPQEKSETHADANADGAEPQDTVIHEDDHSTKPEKDVVAQDADLLSNRGAPLAREDGNDTDVTAEESDDEEKALPAQVHVAMEEEESSDEEGEFEVFASLTQPLSDEQDEDAEVEQEQDELDSERDSLSSDDMQTAQMIPTAACDRRDPSASPKVEDVSIVSATEKDKPPVTRRNTARRGRRRALHARSSLSTHSDPEGGPPVARESTARCGQKCTLAIQSSPPHDLPSSRSPPLPSEPDVFMDKASLSTHAQSSVHKQSISGSQNGIQPHAGTLSIPTSYRKPRQSSSVQINAEAGPSTIIPGPSKSPSSSPSRPRVRFLLHDPVAWAAPSFLRNSDKTAPSKKTEKTTSAVSAGSSARHKEKQTVIGSSAKCELKEQQETVSTDGVSRLPVNTFATSQRSRPTEEPETSNADFCPTKRRKHEETPSLPQTPYYRESMLKSWKPALSSIREQERMEDMQSPGASGSRSSLGQPPARRKGKLGGFVLELDVDVSSHPDLITWHTLGATMKAVVERRKEEQERGRQAR